MQSLLNKTNSIYLWHWIKLNWYKLSFINKAVLIYFCMVQSRLLYCITTWCDGNRTILSKLKNSCNKFIKVINKKQHIVRLTKLNYFLSIDQLFFKEISSFTFKYKKKLLPTIFHNMFTMSKTSRRVTRRNNSQIIPTCCSTNISQHSIRFVGLKIWNSLPKVVKGVLNLLIGC